LPAEHRLTAAPVGNPLRQHAVTDKPVVEGEVVGDFVSQNGFDLNSAARLVDEDHEQWWVVVGGGQTACRAARDIAPREDDIHPVREISTLEALAVGRQDRP